ncbi:hypothetical protein GGR57DRAFT_518995 [Xylariaceae sp. FL1272]|nr:hypothetical protein GGR57DRAFT_518995 [Xylariaceae sp. FL1272]
MMNSSQTAGASRKPYACTWPGCNTRCTTKYNLTSHVRKHQAPTHECPYCQVKFWRRDMKADHVLKHHVTQTDPVRREGRNRCCPFCEVKNERGCNISLHILGAHIEPNLRQRHQDGDNGQREQNRPAENGSHAQENRPRTPEPANQVPAPHQPIPVHPSPAAPAESPQRPVVDRNQLDHIDQTLGTFLNDGYYVAYGLENTFPRGSEIRGRFRRLLNEALDIQDEIRAEREAADDEH